MNDVAPMRNAETYSTISPIDAKAYLLAKGWRQTDIFGDKALAFSHGNSTEQAILPLRTTLGDYALRLAELVHTISAVEGRDPSWILKDLRLSGFDVFRIRLIDNTKDGTIPVSSTPSILNDAKDMLLSAASACVKLKSVWGARRGKDVEEFMGKVRLGQTE